MLFALFQLDLTRLLLELFDSFLSLIPCFIMLILQTFKIGSFGLFDFLLLLSTLVKLVLLLGDSLLENLSFLKKSLLLALDRFHLLLGSGQVNVPQFFKLFKLESKVLNFAVFDLLSKLFFEFLPTVPLL